jgi:hypothetical protein
LAPNGKAYYPCGLIANSLFNDTIRSPVALNSAGAVDGTKTYNMTNKGIAWSSDAELYSKTVYTNSQVMPPPNWHNRYPDGYTDQNPIPDLAQYEEFQVWMRTAGLPTFSKLALRNDDAVMTAGTYQIEISECNFYPGAYLMSFANQYRFPCHGIRWHQVYSDINKDCHGWQEPFLGNCLCRGWWPLHCLGRCIHYRTPCQTKVCIPSRSWNKSQLTPFKKIGGSHLSLMEQ